MSEAEELNSATHPRTKTRVSIQAEAKLSGKGGNCGVWKGKQFSPPLA